jgi:NTP pyrophosphatase (non-canonical NTP hydrolase)
MKRVSNMSINKIRRFDVDEFAFKLRNDKNLLDEYQRIAGQSAIYPGAKGPFGLAYVGLKLNGEAGEFAEHVGKAFRDDNFGQYNGDVTDVVPLTPQRKQALLKEIGDILWYCQAACRELDSTLSQVALLNLEKLCDRGERDKLGGSGDER